MTVEKVIDAILEYVEPEEEITASSTLKYDCGLTSFDSTCVLGDLCDEAGISEGALNLRKIETVGDLCDAINAASAE